MRYRYGAPADSDEDFASIVARTKDLQTITRSTVPLLAWWRDYALTELAPGVDLSRGTARFEYAVTATCTACNSKGKASMTDVMLLLADRSIAIEGKFTEPRYERVDSWRRKGKDPANRNRVLGHWCHLIHGHTGTAIDQAKLDTVVYQTIHRVASACAAAPRGGDAEVLYLVFHDAAGAVKEYAADLAIASQILDPDNRITFSLVEIPTSKGRHFVDVAGLVDSALDDEERSEILAEALVTRREIYCYGEPRRKRIR